MTNPTAIVPNTQVITSRTTLATSLMKIMSCPIPNTNALTRITHLRLNSIPEPSKASNLAKIVPKIMIIVAINVMISCPH